MKKIKVLMLVPNLQVASGVSSFVMNYFRNIDHNKLQMDFAVYSDVPTPYYKEIKRCGSKVYILPNIKNPIVHFKKCSEILKNENYDIIHNNTLHIALPMMICAKIEKVPVRIMHSHSTKLGETPFRNIRNKLLMPLLLILATNFVACSKLAGKAMFGKKSFKIIPNTINTSEYIFNNTKRNNIRKIMHVENKFVIGSVGRLAYPKNPFFAIDVIKKVLQECPKVEYWWIGNGPLEKDIAYYIKQNGLEDSIKLLGSRNDVINLYQAIDVFFLPSNFEGLPLTGIEAQAMGLPMLVSDVVTDEMVYTDLVMYESLKNDVLVWASDLKNILNKIKYSNEREQYNLKLINSIFSDSKCGEKIMEFYNSIMI